MFWMYYAFLNFLHNFGDRFFCFHFFQALVQKQPGCRGETQQLHLIGAGETHEPRATCGHCLRAGAIFFFSVGMLKHAETACENFQFFVGKKTWVFF